MIQLLAMGYRYNAENEVAFKLVRSIRIYKRVIKLANTSVRHSVGGAKFFEIKKNFRKKLF